MIGTILVPLDGTTFAEQALVPACRLARSARARLLLVRAAPYADHSAMAGAHMSTTDLHLRVTLRDAERYLEAVQARLVEQGFVARIEALHTHAAHGILFAARVHGADIIVMSTHGREGMERAFAGSVADHVLQGAHVPVMLVRVMEHPPAPDVGPFRTVLVPLDGTPSADVALAYLARQEGALGHPAPIVLMAISPTHDERRVAEIRQHLELVSRRSLGRVVPDIRVVPGPAARAIVEMTDRADVDLVIMVTHGRTTGIHGYMHSSTAKQVLHAASVPVLLLPDAAIAALAEPEGASSKAAAEEVVRDRVGATG